MANKKGMNPLTVGAIGAAVGAAVGIAAVELSDPKNRKAIQKKIGELEEKGEQAYAELQKTATEVKGKTEDFANEAGENRTS